MDLMRVLIFLVKLDVVVGIWVFIGMVDVIEI